jgi:phosphatidylserine/phosphatidylglycerophosphate/cardiolipin synthase-like enzyme
LDVLPNTCQHSFDGEIYGCTDLVLVTNIIAAANRGVKVRVFNDLIQEKGPADHHAMQMLVDAGAVNGNIQVKVGKSRYGLITHLKLGIGDGADGALADTSFVTYGSYNWSGNFDAGKRPEGAQGQTNVLVITNDPGEVAQALAKFELDWVNNEQKPEWQVQPTHPPITTPTPASTPEAAAAVMQAAVPQVAEGAPA